MADSDTPAFPVDPAATDVSKRRTLLMIGDELGWWAYGGENRPGYVDPATGRRYDTVTYTVGALVLLPEEVIGYVLRTAEERGEVDVIRYREGL